MRVYFIIQIANIKVNSEKVTGKFSDQWGIEFDWQRRTCIANWPMKNDNLFGPYKRTKPGCFPALLSFPCKPYLVICINVGSICWNISSGS